MSVPRRHRVAMAQAKRHARDGAHITWSTPPVRVAGRELSGRRSDHHGAQQLADPPKAKHRGGTTETMHDMLRRTLVQKNGRGKREMERDVQEKLYCSASDTHATELRITGKTTRRRPLSSLSTSSLVDGTHRVPPQRGTRLGTAKEKKNTCHCAPTCQRAQLHLEGDKETHAHPEEKHH